MQFEQFQEKDGKNIINITVEKDDSEALKTDTEKFIHEKDISLPQNTTAEQEKKAPVITNEIKINPENSDRKYERYQYLLLGGIILTSVLLVTIIILYVKGF
jgi:hypothetical protein